ncbi:MAG: hypothetical protein EBX67_03265 [Betaproteobacteria bacterium]|nr:hypothetical protein [Betaproteobacteria bacterium]
MSATLVTRFKNINADGSILEVVVWRLPRPLAPSTHPYKYRAVYAVGGVRIVGLIDITDDDLITVAFCKFCVARINLNTHVMALGHLLLERSCQRTRATAYLDQPSRCERHHVK